MGCVLFISYFSNFSQYLEEYLVQSRAHYTSKNSWVYFLFLIIIVIHKVYIFWDNHCKTTSFYIYNFNPGTWTMEWKNSILTWILFMSILLMYQTFQQDSVVLIGDSQTRSFSTVYEFMRNVKFLGPSQIYWFRNSEWGPAISFLTKLLSVSDAY